MCTTRRANSALVLLEVFEYKPGMQKFVIVQLICDRTSENKSMNILHCFAINIGYQPTPQCRIRNLNCLNCESRVGAR